MEGFRIDLKTFLGLAKPSLTNTPKVSEIKYQAGFGVKISGQNPQTFMILVLPYYMIMEPNEHIALLCKSVFLLI